jgi:hypothetical protein
MKNVFIPLMTQIVQCFMLHKNSPRCVRNILTFGSAIPYEGCAYCHGIKGQDDALQWAWLHYTHPEQSDKQQNNDRNHPDVINLNGNENANDLKLFQYEYSHYEND